MIKILKFLDMKNLYPKAEKMEITRVFKNFDETYKTILHLLNIDYIFQ